MRVYKTRPGMASLDYSGYAAADNEVAGGSPQAPVSNSGAGPGSDAAGYPLHGAVVHITNLR